MKKIFIVGLAVCSSWGVFAQNETDALRYSFFNNPMSVRSMGMGGAFGALGADLSSFHNNPAGIALYKRGGVEFGFGLNMDATSALYEGTNSESNRDRFFMNNLGLVSAGKTNNDKWAYGLGVSHTKLQNYNQNTNISGTAFNTSILDQFASQANGIPYDQVSDMLPFSSGLAWETYLIDPLDTTANTYVAAAGAGDVKQRLISERKGYVTETAIGGGLSYDDFVYFGVSIGFQNVNYRDNSSYGEYYDGTGAVSNMNFGQDLITSGVGLNLKLGAIVRVTEWMRAGAFVQTPTRLSLSDSYSATMESNWTNDTPLNWNSPINNFNYVVKTPGRLGANAAFILGDLGVVTADYEMINYGKIKMDNGGDSDYTFSNENDMIGAVYRNTHRVRTGVEFRIANDWRLRTGASYTQSPFVANVAENSPILSYNGGFGYRHDGFTFDFGTQYQTASTTYYMFDPSYVNAAQIKQNRLSILASIGFKF